jgi:hypothetical protein
VGRAPDAAAAAVPAPRAATVAIATALAERSLVSTFLLRGVGWGGDPNGS